MTSFWRNWLLAWVAGVALFGVVLAERSRRQGEGAEHREDQSPHHGDRGARQHT